MWKSRYDEGTTKEDRSFLKKSGVNGLPCCCSGPENCTHSGYPAITAVTQAATPRPAATVAILSATARGRLTASTAIMMTPAMAVPSSVSSVMNTCADTSRPSQRPPRTTLVRPVASRRPTSTINGGSTANCRS